MEYRRKVYDLVIRVIETAPLELPITQDHPWVGRYHFLKISDCFYIFVVGRDYEY